MTFNADKSGATPSAQSCTRPPAAAEIAAELLREAILTGHYKSGDQLRETHIAARLGLSRNTIREAYRKLEAEGLVTHVPNYGVYVTKFDLKRVKELYAFRRTTEVGSLAALTPKEAVELGQTLAAIYAAPTSTSKNYRAISERNALFHLAIVAASGSPELMAVAESIMGQMRLYFYNHPERAALLLSTESHHRPIIDALLKGDHHKAAVLMHNYLSTSFVAVTEPLSG